MSLTSIEELRLKAIESKLNSFQKAIRNLASKEELKQLLLVKETVEVVLRQIVDETVSMSALTDTNIINLQNNQFLQWNGTKWVNVDPSEETSYKLGDLLDVTLTNTIDKSFIYYDQSTDEWLDVSLMTWNEGTGTITMVPADPGVVKVETGYINRSEVDENTLITKGYVDERFALLIPPAPDNFPGGQLLSFSTSSEGNTPRLCSPKNSISATDNTNGGTITAAPGDSVHRVETGHSISTNTITSVGPGDSGTLTALANATDTGSVTFTSGDEAGTYTNLVVSNNVDFPAATPGFYKSFDCRIANWSATPSGSGWNSIQIQHTAGFTNILYFIEDDLAQSPIFSDLTTATITEINAGSLKTITGVPQYNSGAILEFSGVGVQNITKETYYGGSDTLTVQTTAKVTSLNSNKKNYTDIGTPGGATPERQINNHTLSSIQGTIDNVSGYGEHYLQIKFKNVHGTTSGNLTLKKLLLASGTPTTSGDIDESVGIPVVNLGSDPNSNYAVRVNNDSQDDTPAIADHTVLYDHSVAPSFTAAINAGGKLGFNIVDYSQIYLPVGPDLASVGRSTEQFVTYAFQRRPVSKFDIEFTGSLAGMWISLPGVSSSNQNDWLDMSQSYLGVGNPGSNGSNGCALSGVVQLNSNGMQRRTCTFGGMSSNSVVDNYILVRIKFTGGQELSQLVFREASN
jgi:hypothetical protein